MSKQNIAAFLAQTVVMLPAAAHAEVDGKAFAGTEYTVTYSDR